MPSIAKPFHKLAGDLLIRLGYEPNNEWAEGGMLSGASP